MEEEKKELEAQEVEEVAVEAAPVASVDEEANAKNALTAFILSLIAFVLIETGLGGIILGAISLGFQKKVNGEIERQPHRTFLKVAKPVAIVSLVLGILVLVAAVIWGIVALIMFLIGVAAEYAGAMSAIALLF